MKEFSNITNDFLNHIISNYVLLPKYNLYRGNKRIYSI